jgi:hypothetical protein
MDMPDWVIWMIPVSAIPIHMLSSKVSARFRSKFGLPLWPNPAITIFLAIVTLCSPFVSVMIFRDCVDGPPIVSGTLLCATLLIVLSFNFHRLNWRNALLASVIHIAAILVLLVVGSFPVAVLFAMASRGGAGHSGCSWI